MNESVSIVGLGVVGSAVHDSFEIKRITVLRYDKYKGEGSLELCTATDIIFLCLPTLFSDERKEYDKSEIYKTCQELERMNYPGLVVVKSTVEPGTVDELLIKHPKLRIVHNPEFLSAATAFFDFHHQKHIVIGGPSKDVESLAEFYRRYYDADITVCTAVESETMKIFVNNFYAVKIQFFNEMYSACKHNGAEYDKVRDMMLKNGWIHPQHTRVPGPDGLLSYGGMCFPKDTCALSAYLNVRALPSEVIDATIREHDKMRSGPKK